MIQNNYYKSHKLFFLLSSHEKLNEFLKRADESTKVLETHINEQLNDGKYCKVKVKKCIMIIIEFYNVNSILLGHVTFHLEPEMKNKYGSNNKFGRIHIQNERNKQLRYVLKLNRVKQNNTDNSFQFSITHSYIKSYLSPFIHTSIHILYEYFNTSSPLSINNRLAQKYSYNINDQPVTSYWHKCFIHIKERFNISAKARRNILKSVTHKRKRT